MNDPQVGFGIPPWSSLWRNSKITYALKGKGGGVSRKLYKRVQGEASFRKP